MADKMDIRDRAKALWLKGMKAVGNTAASIANNTRYKVDEVTIQNRRREVLGDLANKAYALWLKGESFPQPMIRMLEELKRLDEQLNDMRAEKYAASVSIREKGTSRTQDEKADTAAEEEETEANPVFPSGQSPVCTEINELFDNTSSVGKMAEKVNSTLDQMSECIRKFPADEEAQKRQD
ncbi:MAG: hypothetical protein J5841_00565 [Clostridia bacterium]|nr:hypothetical protein [Clostridia bacterium]